MAGLLKITLIRSAIGKPEKHRKVLKALGLNKMHKTVCLADTPVVQGMINKISHMVRVEEAGDEA
ncbi:MAG: 50S ribosomal protein L30 [Desulfosudaceae bacterium]